MRKLFAIVLSVVMMFSVFNVSVKAVNLEETAPVSTTEPTGVNAEITQEELEDGKITIKVIEKMCSWDELVNMVIPTKPVYAEIENKEDLYVVMLVDGITKQQEMENNEYFDLVIGGIKRQMIDLNRLMQKFQDIIDIFNQYHEIQLVLEYTILNETYMQVNVKSTNVKEVVIPSFPHIGKFVILKDGATYWESSKNFGSGNFGVATDNNRHIPENYTVMVNGFAYFDESKINIVDFYYKPYNEVEVMEIKVKYIEQLMLHICTETSDLGWVYAGDVVCID